MTMENGMNQCEECDRTVDGELIQVGSGTDKNGHYYTHNVCSMCADLVYGWPDEFGEEWNKTTCNR